MVIAQSPAGKPAQIVESGRLWCWWRLEALVSLNTASSLGFSSGPRWSGESTAQTRWNSHVLVSASQGADTSCSAKSSKSVCTLAVKLLECIIKTIHLMYEMITYSVKSTREMHYLTQWLMMVFSLELNTASVVIIYVLHRWGPHKWISKPCWGQCYYTDFLLLSKSFCFWQCELTTKWKCVPPT